MSKHPLLNVIPNFVGVGAGMIFPLLFNIVYYRLLGTEGYGLIGFYGALAILASLADLGLNQTALREIARRASDDNRAGELRSVFVTLASIASGIGLVVGLLAVMSSRWLATSWLSFSRFSASEVTTAIVTMGGILTLLFPANVFNATLRALQLQVVCNAISVVTAALRGVATIAALQIFGVTPITFFSSQLLLSALEVSILGTVVWKHLPRSPAPLRFDFQMFQASWRFSLTVWFSTVIGQLVMLSDKAVMSTVLSLELFGLYSIAFAVASTIQRLVTPFSNAYLPHFVELVEKDGYELLSQAYNLASRLASSVVICAGFLMLIYAQPIMLLLTGNTANTAIIAPVFAIMSVANTLASLMVMPQMLQLACGAPWIALRINLFQAVPYVVLLVLLVPRLGMYAPAGLWLATAGVNLAVMTIMTHQVALRGEAWAWFKHAIVLPTCAAASVLFAGALVLPEPSPAAMIPWFVLNYALALAAALFCAFRGRFPQLHAQSGSANCDAALTNDTATVPSESPKNQGKR
jgi:O-antigen/teichoic acid export membrane protein